MPIEEYRLISRNAAEGRYRFHLTSYIFPCTVSPNETKDEPYEISAQRVDGKPFSTIVADYERRCCNRESGEHPLFYMKVRLDNGKDIDKKKLLATYLK